MIIGISGHRKIKWKVIQFIKDSILTVLNEMPIKMGLTSLAIGADQIFAQCLLDREIPYIAIIPCKKYAKTFSRNEIKQYEKYLKESFSINTLPYDEPSNFAFYKAGIKIVIDSDILVCVWDGNKARGLGGTEDIFHFAMHNKKKIIHVDIKKNELRRFNF